MPRAGTKVLMFVATAAEWSVPHEILEENWIGVESDTGLMKLGNGVTRWVDLPYMANSEIIPGGVPYTSPTTTAPASYAFKEATDNGVHAIELQAPPSLPANAAVVLPGAADTIVGRNTVDTLQNKTLVSPLISSVSPASMGMVLTQTIQFLEAEAPGFGQPFIGMVNLPAGSWLHDIRITTRVLWNGGVARAGGIVIPMAVGDTANYQGYFAAINLAEIDLLVGEVLAISDSTLWGGKQGAYLNSTTGRRGPTTGNFGCYYAAGTNIFFTVNTSSNPGGIGVTYAQVIYSRSIMQSAS